MYNPSSSFPGLVPIKLFLLYVMKFIGAFYKFDGILSGIFGHVKEFYTFYPTVLL